MNSSSAKTLGVILIVLAALAFVGFLRFFLLIPLGVADGVGHGLRTHIFDRDWSWFWPWAGFAGFFGLIYLFFWIMVLVWVYRDAQKRGMEGVLWALLVFFLHWIGLIIYLLVRSGRPVRPISPPAPVAPMAPPPPKPAFCPACGKPSQSEWSVCPFCGGKL